MEAERQKEVSINIDDSNTEINAESPSSKRRLIVKKRKKKKKNNKFDEVEEMEEELK